ncbi:RNA-binding protein [Pengzhenrongella frigida]|uniref:RNA-binding protein n=1 Tax=Pengzhenrongella frigida TaxID=1259133 RepID=A0A4Q5MUW9_9MICO|nr:RNA-binding protein [Cellulomonas sp. HLT2-17]RYV49362.1 RNA-binding protein [Cellulomonas sp. HLT2-17]
MIQEPRWARAVRAKDRRCATPFTYRVTQYDPLDRDTDGFYIGEVDSISDEGPLEAAYLDAVDAFACELGVTRLTIRSPRLNGDSPDDAPRAPGEMLATLFGKDLAGYVDGAHVDIPGARLLVQDMLREPAQRCLLEAEGRMLVDVGWDVYMYIGAATPCPVAVAGALAGGLFPEPFDMSPADPADGTPDHGTDGSVPVGDTFWADVDRLSASEGAVLLQELGAWTRWHRLTADSPRVVLRPRAQVWVWPDLLPDVGAAIASLPSDEGVTIVWLPAEGPLRARDVMYDDLEEIPTLLAGARAAMWRDGTEDTAPLLEAFVADDDGVIRSRGRTFNALCGL